MNPGREPIWVCRSFTATSGVSWFYRAYHHFGGSKSYKRDRPIYRQSVWLVSTPPASLHGRCPRRTLSPQVAKNGARVGVSGGLSPREFKGQELWVSPPPKKERKTSSKMGFPQKGRPQRPLTPIWLGTLRETDLRTIVICGDPEFQSLA